MHKEAVTWHAYFTTSAVAQQHSFECPMSLKDEASWASDKSSQNHTGKHTHTHTLTLSRTSHLLSECGICRAEADSGFGTHAGGCIVCFGVWKAASKWNDEINWGCFVFINILTLLVVLLPYQVTAKTSCSYLIKAFTRLWNITATLSELLLLSPLVVTFKKGSGQREKGVVGPPEELRTSLKDTIPSKDFPVSCPNTMETINWRVPLCIVCHICIYKATKNFCATL